MIVRRIEKDKIEKFPAFRKHVNARATGITQTVHR